MFTMSWRRWTRLDLKDQYFGCEIEMTGITREQAAQAVAALFGTTARQTHESHTYDPWEVTDNAGKKWRFVYDGSIETTRRECGRQAAVHDRRYSVEMNSPKLEYSEMKKLQEVDEVAYVRFASVYREFKDVNTFMEEIGKLLKK